MAKQEHGNPRKARRAQRRKRRTFLALDIGVSLFALVCAALGLLFFYRSVHRTFTKNAPAIAHITYKKHTVQRRFSERFLWGQTARDTPLYNGDLVRTAAISDASIVFNNDDVLTLSENTLVQIFYSEKGTLIDFNSGKLDVKSTEGNMSVRISDKTIQAGSESSLQIETSADGANVRTLGGSAVLEQDGVQQTLDPDSAWTLNNTGTLTPQDALIVLRPLPDSYFLIPSGLTASTVPGNAEGRRAVVPFEWSTGGFTPKEYVRLEASRSRNFDTVDRRLDLYGERGAELELETGDWWWRAWRPERENPQGVIANGKILVAAEAKPASGQAAEDTALNNLLENLNAENPVVFEEPPPELTAEEPPEPPPEPPQAPRNLRPPENFLFGTAYLNSSKTLVFSCEAVPGADSYIWTFTRGGKTITRTTTTPQCRLEAAAAASQFTNGRCQWTVEAQANTEGGVVRGNAARSYFRLDIPPAPAPVLKPPVEIAQ